MTAAGESGRVDSTFGSKLSRALAWHDPAAQILKIDILTVLIALALPWSTSAVSILAVIWVIALAFTVDVTKLAASLKQPVCILPVALVALAAVGTLWSEVPWPTRLQAIGPTAKLLFLPLLFYHFQRSTRATWVFLAFLGSCTLLMMVSWLVAFEPVLTLKPVSDRTCGVFVKNYIDQGQEFGLCAVALIYPVMVLLKERRHLLAGLFIAAALGMLAHMVFVIASRTSLAIMPLLLAIFAFRHLQWRGGVALMLVTVIGGLAWAVTPRMCRTVETLSRDLELYQERSEPTSAGLRIEYWKKSLQFIREAPLVGHGTGSIRDLFQKAVAGDAVQASGHVVANPHNQTLAVAIQWGLVGSIVLYAMWLIHLLLFRGPGLVAWIGLLVVTQNILSSLFNSHLFDFHAGWMYVLGVGVAGGAVFGVRLRKQALPSVSGP